jgi:hypothetical protein
MKSIIPKKHVIFNTYCRLDTHKQYQTSLKTNRFHLSSCNNRKTCIYIYINMEQTHPNKSAKDCSLEMGSSCIAMRTRVINRVISRIYDEALRPFGIKGSQMSILAVISGFGRAEPSEICRLLQLDASTLSRNVSRMKNKGWLKAATRSDRRAHRLELTADGDRIIE